MHVCSAASAAFQEMYNSNGVAKVHANARQAHAEILHQDCGSEYSTGIPQLLPRFSDRASRVTVPQSPSVLRTHGPKRSLRLLSLRCLLPRIRSAECLALTHLSNNHSPLGHAQSLGCPRRCLSAGGKQVGGHRTVMPRPGLSSYREIGMPRRQGTAPQEGESEAG